MEKVALFNVQLLSDVTNKIINTASRWGYTVDGDYMFFYFNNQR